MNSIEKAVALNAIASDGFAGERFLDLVVERMPEEMRFSVEECSEVRFEKLADENLRLLGITQLGNFFANLDSGAIRINRVSSPFLEFPPQFENGFMQHRAIHNGTIGRIALSRRIQVPSCYGGIVSAREVAIWKIPEGGDERARDVRAATILRTRMDEALSHPTFTSHCTKLLGRGISEK